jgi:DNA replication ATP-dependent helicase Dna2
MKCSPKQENVAHIRQILTVEEEKTKRKKSIILRQSWVETPCTTDSYVHVVGDFSADGQCIVDDCKNMLILHPDHLISATTVGDSFGCMRKAVLQDRVKATSRANAPMLYGTILHELFQESLKANRWDTIWLDECIAKILPSHLETILDIGETLESITEHLKSKLPELQSWAEVFVRTQPGVSSILSWTSYMANSMVVGRYRQRPQWHASCHEHQQTA